MVLLISYDLNGRERPSAYTRVKNAIERNALSYRKPLYSQWLVETNHSPDQWSDMLLTVMDADDRLLVVRVRWPYQGWLSNDVWTWLQPRAN